MIILTIVTIFVLIIALLGVNFVLGALALAALSLTGIDLATLMGG